MGAERRRQLLYLIAGSGIAALAIVLGVMFLGGGGGDTTEQRLAAGGCKLTTAPGLAGKHIPPSAKPKWNTDPPSNGDQANEQVVWGSYQDPVSLRSVVHNLEHGGVYILYGKDVSKAEVAKIEEFYTDDPDGLVVAPLPRLGRTIALGAWYVPEGGPEFGQGKLARCARFDDGAFSAFIGAFGFQGLERAPRELLKPGT
jgi:hypothetical protein